MFSKSALAISCVFIALALGASSCQKGEAPTARADAEAPLEVPPAMELAVLIAQRATFNAHVGAFQNVSRHLERRVREEDRVGGDRPEGFDKVVTIAFGANNRGEREDCGCRANPLGGLTRRHTLIELAKQGQSEEAEKFWGKNLPESSTVFVVDAGDLFFRRIQFERAPENEHAMYWTRAQAILDAVNLSPPDAFALGHEDFAMGRVKTQLLAKGAKFPFLSANLRNDEERLFEGHHIVERDGVRVAFIGLSAEDEAFFKTQGLTLHNSLAAYREEVEQLDDTVDLVVLLSNLGMGRTADLVREIRGEGLAISAAIVSNTGRFTRQVEWIEGVPLMEPEIRGKHFGRMDIYLDESRRGAKTLRYANGGNDGRRQVQTWRNAYLEYVQARQRRDDARQELETIRLHAHHKEESDSDADEGARDQRAKVEATMEQFEKQIAIFERRVEVTSETYRRISGELAKLGDMTTGQAGATAWLDGRVVPVHPTIAEDPGVRRVLNRWEPRGAAHTHQHSHQH